MRTQRTVPSRTPGSPPDSAEGWSRRDAMQITGAALPMAWVGLQGGVAVAEATSGGGATQTLKVALTINGRVHRLEVDPRVSLLDLLRERLQLHGTKKGCNQGACGACTVLVDGKRINACLTLAIMHDGAAVTTIEGLAGAEPLHPVQRAFIKHDAFQCGYCTPGQILSAVACIAEGHAGSPEEIKA
jgi:xanthine dehydrogenase YagT iron-sulfur-binding subunit